jgi:hypothetical protein
MPRCLHELLPAQPARPFKQFCAVCFTRSGHICGAFQQVIRCERPSERMPPRGSSHGHVEDLTLQGVPACYLMAPIPNKQA